MKEKDEIILERDEVIKERDLLRVRVKELEEIIIKNNL